MNLKLHGEIVNAETKEFNALWGVGEQNVSYKDLDEALAQKSDDDKVVNMDIHCPGGDCIEGFAIYDRLRSLEDHTITGNVRGECSSMATVVLCAASRRISQPNARFCIHKPRYMYYFKETMTEDEAQKLHDDLHAETERLKAIYIDRTSMTAEQVEELMKQDKYITAEEALEIGLITEIAEPMTAKKTQTNITHNMAKHRLKSWQKKAMSAIGLGDLVAEIEQQAVAMTLNTEDGSTIEVEREEGDPQVGDAASPDGEHLMSDGTTIVITDGVITEIRPAEEQEETEEEAMTTEEMEATIATMTETIETLTAENEELKRQLSASKANEKTAEDSKVLKLVDNAGGLKWLESLKTNYKPASREVTDTKMSADEERQRMLDKAREMYKKNK